jgi:glucosamine 6-phosphate synthetase-like amidotransferase/phosphosugar isomerase protein
MSIMRSVFPAILCCAIFLQTSVLQNVAAQSAPAAERQKIEALIKSIADAKDLQFVRNGRVYDATIAAKFLRGKWAANDAEVKTARAFVNKVASFSATSGEPYLIRRSDGTEIKSNDYLLAELRKLEKAEFEQRASDRQPGP